MQTSVTLVDFEFGISQLSGNKALLLTLLQKFAAEYRHTSVTLEKHFSQHQWEQAKLFVHTLKGVAGNLGCTFLHTCCVELEIALENDNAIPPSYEEFIAALEETLAVIDKVSTDVPAVLPPKNEQSSPIPDAKTALLKALWQNQFIPQQQLEKWLAAITPDDAKQKIIKNAVDELDYSTAIALIQD